MRLIREEKAFIREAVLLMLPMILQNFVTFSMSMADTFMVGVLGETALAAVTMANSPFYVMQLMIFGVQSGMSVLVAQYHGRGDQEAINRVMGIALFVSTTITGLLAVTAFCIPEQIMRVLTNNADLVAPGAAYTRYVGLFLLRHQRRVHRRPAQHGKSPPRRRAAHRIRRAEHFPQLGAHLRQARRAHARLRGRSHRHAHQPRVRGRGAVRVCPVQPPAAAHAARAAAPRPRDRKGLCQVRPARRVQ